MNSRDRTFTPTKIERRKQQIDESIQRYLAALDTVPVGGTGEFISLTEGKRLAMVEATVEAVGGKVPVVAGVIHPGMHDTIKASKDYLRAGADSVMVVTPYCYRPTQRGIIE